MEIKTVTVIGGNGTLGKLTSAIFASFGDAKVFVVSRSKEKSVKAIEDAASSVKADVIKKNLVAQTYDNLEECISKSDLVLECIVEELGAKKEVHKRISSLGKEDIIYASVTSGISINTLATCYDKELKKRFLGIHFFNPPYNLQLCELIPCKHTSDEILQEVKKYLENTLYRKVVIVKDQPGFLANRIGFKFINKALQFAEKYKNYGGIDYIDSILGRFTGRNMPPILTADFVGLDVHKAIVDNLYENTNDYEHETFKMPSYVDELIEKGSIGKKVNEGLYKVDNLGKLLVYDIAKKEYRKAINYNFEFTAYIIEQFENANYVEGIKRLGQNDTLEARICLEFLRDYIKYSLFVVEEVGDKITDCDIAMAEGFNWIPPIALLQAFRDAKVNVELDTDKELKSKYDYRKFLKAKE